MFHLDELWFGAIDSPQFELTLTEECIHNVGDISKSHLHARFFNLASQLSQFL